MGHAYNTQQHLMRNYLAQTDHDEK